MAPLNLWADAHPGQPLCVCHSLLMAPTHQWLGKRPKKYKRKSYSYSHKKHMVDLMNEGVSLNRIITESYGTLSTEEIRARKKMLNKWRKSTTSIQPAVATGRGSHHNTRHRGDATVLSKAVEEQLVVWINSFRKDGAPVSRLMLRLRAKELAAVCDVADKFAASDTWIMLFMRRNTLSLRARTRHGQTTPRDAKEAAEAFAALVHRTVVEKNCVRVFNADQTAVLFELLPKHTISDRGVKTVWMKSSSKDKERATAMLLGDWEGTKYPPFLVFKSAPVKSAATQDDNKRIRNGFGMRVWREIKTLQEINDCQIYGNKCAWWNAELSIEFLKYHFANRVDCDDSVLLLWDDFSGHWTAEVVDCAATLNVILLKVPPRYTYVCQPADNSWNKPLKAGLRARWVRRLREQIETHAARESTRQHAQDEFKRAIVRAQLDLVREEANEVIAELHNQQRDDPFRLAAPTRTDITQWVSSCWDALTKETIVSGFAKPGLLNDTRVLDTSCGPSEIVSYISDELEALMLTDGTVDSDDDIGSAIDSDESDA